MCPSFHRATALPCSAAYVRVPMLFGVSPALTVCGPQSIAAGSTPVPSKPIAEPSPIARPSVAIARAPSIVRIARRLGPSARVGHGPVESRPDLLGVFPQISRRELRIARFPVALAPREFLVRTLGVERAGFRIELHDVAVAQQRAPPAHPRLP